MPIRPDIRELVTKKILHLSGLNAQAYSGAQNPSNVYTLMVTGSPMVMPFYREIEEKDTAIASALAMRRLLVLARDAGVASAAPGNALADGYAQGLSEFLRKIPRFDFALWELLDSPGYGFTVVEILWRIDPDGGIGVEKLVGRPQEIFSFGKFFEPQVGELLLSPTPGGEGAPVPPAKFLVASYQPRHGDRRGLPLLRRLFWPSWFKRNGLRLHLFYLEKGRGTVAVKYPESASANEQAQALTAATALATEIAAAVPQSFSVMNELLQSTRSLQASDFQALINYFDAEMTRVILGQTLTSHGSEQQKGSQALGDVHEDMLWEIVRNDASDLEDVINEQLCEPWLLWTFGPAALDPAVRPMWRVQKDPPKDAAAAVDLLVKAHSLVDVAQADVYEAAQIDPPDEGEAIVPRSAMPTSLFAPGG